MSSINDFQELGFSGEREKLDGFKVVHTGSPQDTKNAANTEFNVRKSLAWDSAFFTSPGVLESDELFQTMNFRSTGNAINFLGREEDILLPSMSLEPERARGIDNYSFRKSLAWDNAFFTSAGVLDPEELSIVNRGFKKCELPGINEVWRSADSISTIDSGCSPLASLEFELFEDSRGLYVQKPAATTSTLKLRRGRGLQNVHTSKGLEASSRMRMKPMSTSQRQSLNLHRLNRISKEAAVSSQTQLAAVSGKLNPSASLKPPKISNRVNQPSTSAAKRACLGGNDVKMRTANSPAGQSMAVSKKPCLGVPCRVTKSLTPPPKSLSSRSPTTTHESRVCYSPYKGSSIASEDTAGKSPLDSRRKIDSPLVKSAPNGFTTGTPLRSTKTDKDELESSCHPSNLLLTPTSSSYTSPASSIDGWSSVSSSTTFMNKRSQNSVISSGTMSRQVSFESDVSQASDLDINSHEQHCIGHGNQETRVPNHRTEKTSLQTSPAPISASDKPSGLRVPSPKLGFFDEESSSVRSSGSLQFLSGGKSSVSRSGNYSGASNRSGKLHPPRHMAGTGNTKPALRKSGSPCPTIALSPRHPVHIEVQNSSIIEADPKRVMKSNGALKYEVGDDKNCFRTQETGGKKRGSAELGIRKCSMAETKVTEGFMKALKRVNNQPTKENEDPNMHSPGNNLFTLHNDGKANAYYFKDLIDGLTRNIGAIDLGCNVMKTDKSAFIG